MNDGAIDAQFDHLSGTMPIVGAEVHGEDA
jgi:hypothetical protein